MSFAQRLDLRQGQQLVMTPQLQQAIKMLQMSNLELREFVAEELESNPVLETRENDAPDSANREEPAAPETRLERQIAEDRLGLAEDTFDTGRENLFADEAAADRLTEMASERAAETAGLDLRSREASSWASVGGGGGFDEIDGGLENMLTRPQTLREHMTEQLGAATLPADIRFIAADLIDQLDEAGYLRVDPAAVAERLGAAEARVVEAADVLRGFDPSGVAAYDLRDCLALQLKDRNRLDPAMAALLDNLPMLAKRDFAKLLKVCGVDQDDLKEMIAELRALDPKPGAQYDLETPQTLIPDVYVSDNGLSGWTVELNTETLPKLLISKSYAAQVSPANGDGAGEVRAYLSECHQKASWLLKSIDQRAKTILRVASEIVRQQDGFLAEGVSALRPLNLKVVADAIDMHESTVSRVTSNKYMATPRGVFEMKFFFSAAIAATDGGEAHSAEAIRHKIRHLVDGEPADDILSDDRIVAILRSEGVDIARRTVAKYRDALKIPSSVQRRKLKAPEMAL